MSSSRQAALLSRRDASETTPLSPKRRDAGESTSDEGHPHGSSNVQVERRKKHFPEPVSGPGRGDDKKEYPTNMFHINAADGRGANVAGGDARTASRHHISYLMRMWEVAQVDPVRGTVEPDEVPFGPQTGADKWIGTRSFLFFLALWIPLAFAAKLTRIDCTIIAFATAHITLYFVVLMNTGLGLYQSWSCEDGYNTMTRFTVKLSTAATKPLVFSLSNFACSISSTVSTRGTTLNKIIIGVSYSVGGSLFIKFAEINPSNLVDHAAMLIIALAYITVIFTGTYENRTFELDAAVPPLRHHRLKYKEINGSAEPAMTAASQTATDPVYSSYHMRGVLALIGISFVGLSVFYWRDRNNRNSYQFAAWLISLISIVFGILFIVLNSVLESSTKWQESHKGIFQWWTKPASERENHTRGAICIAIELCALTAAITAGIVFQP